MRIRRILTNNALVVLDENGKEQIVCGRGIGYKKRPGDDADDSLVDAVYVKEGDQSFEQIRKTLEALPEEYLLLAQHILTAANVSLNMKLNPVMAVSLADHLYYAIQRFLEGTPIANSLSWEIRRFYQKEYEVGLMALDMVESQFKVRLPEAEAAFIAMHIANGETDDSTMEETFAITKIIEDICNIVRVYFRIEMDVESSYSENIIFFIAEKLNITSRSGNTEVWDNLFLAQPWIIYRDLITKHVFYGCVQEYSDKQDIHEILLSNVTVWNSDGSESYSMKKVYLARNINEFTIEIADYNKGE